MSDKSVKKQNVLNGAMVLVVATALVKIIGAVYKIPLTSIIGSLGRGYFASAYNIYTPVYYPVGQTQIDLQIGNQYMNVNGVARLIDNNGTMPVLSNGRTMLPIRAVVESLGGTINWDANTFTTTVAIGGKNIRIRRKYCY